MMKNTKKTMLDFSLIKGKLFFKLNFFTELKNIKNKCY